MKPTLRADLKKATTSMTLRPKETIEFRRVSWRIKWRGSLFRKSLF